MVDLTERYLFLFVVFILGIYQNVHSQSTEKRREKDLSNTYSSSKANQFLSYDKCMQRMNCPATRKEECSEECRAGNTEEEVEEHKELTRDEHPSDINNRPKPKFEPNINMKKPANNSTDQSTIKTDL